VLVQRCGCVSSWQWRFLASSCVLGLFVAVDVAVGLLFWVCFQSQVDVDLYTDSLLTNFKAHKGNSTHLEAKQPSRTFEVLRDEF